MIWSAFSLVKLTREYVGLIPGIRHFMRSKLYHLELQRPKTYSNKSGSRPSAAIFTLIAGIGTP